MVVYAQRDRFYSGIFADIGLECEEERLSTILFEIRMKNVSSYFKKWLEIEIKNKIRDSYFKK